MDTTTHWVILPPCICMCFHASLHSWMVSSKVYGLRVCHRSHPQSHRFVIVHTQHTSLLRVWSPEHSKNCVLCGNALSFCDTIKSTTTTTTNLEKMALSHFFILSVWCALVVEENSLTSILLSRPTNITIESVSVHLILGTVPWNNATNKSENVKIYIVIDKQQKSFGPPHSATKCICMFIVHT